MGCDIHFFVERKIKDSDTWISCDTWKETDEGMSHKFTYELIVPYDKQFYNDRNYNLFAKLADVRNYDDVEPIAEPRGLPKDISELVSNANIRLEGDSTAESWLTLEEMLKEDWTGSEYKEFTKTLKEMKKLGDPDKVRAVFWFDN